MSDPGAQGDLSTLKRFARRGQQAAQAAMESCDFCGEPIPTEHRHLLEVSKTRSHVCLSRLVPFSLIGKPPVWESFVYS